MFSGTVEYMDRDSESDSDPKSSQCPSAEYKERPYKCSRAGCYKAYIKKAHLVRHDKVAHSGVPKEVNWFICDVCQNGYQSKHSLKKHIYNAHLQEYKYRCQYCSKGFTKENWLTAHVSLHTGLKSFKCDLCDKTFFNQCDKGKHQRKHKTLVCECGKTFYSRVDITSHRQAEHKKIHQCDTCHKIFKQKHQLKEHLENCCEKYQHEGATVYICNMCPKSYSLKRNLMQHIKSAHERLTFDCDFPGCESKLSSKQKLQLHMKSKHSDNNRRIIDKANRKDVKPRKKRRDVGTMVRSTAVKLAGVSVALDVEKQIIKESEEKFMNNIEIDVTKSNTNETTDAIIDNISETTEGTKEVINETTVVEKDSEIGTSENI